MMRVSTIQFYNTNLNSVLDIQSQLSQTEKELTGFRVNQASDDPIAAATISKLQQTLSQVAFYESNTDFATSRLSQEDVVLDQVYKLLMHVRDLVTQANNDTLSTTDRAGIATELNLRLEEMVSLANSKDGTGEYIFGGFYGNTLPFVFNNTGGVSFNGTSGQRLLQIGTSTQVAIGDSGYDVFEAIKNGNGVFNTAPALTNIGTGVIDIGTVTIPSTVLTTDYTVSFLNSVPPPPPSVFQYTVKDSLGTIIVPPTTFVPDSAISFGGISFTIDGLPDVTDEFFITPSKNQSIFTTIEQCISAITQPSSVLRASLVGACLENLDNSLENVNIMDSNVGARLNTVSSTAEQNLDSSVLIQKHLSDIRDVDLTQAISDLKRQMIALEAAQQVYATLSNMSLFNFMK